MANTSSDKILARLKGLRTQMREGEQPLFSIPAIWENATDHQSNACDLVLTNQRLFGYIYATFPRERLFLDALELNAITAVSIRQKSFEAMFRELLVCDHTKRIYIRATGKKIEETYTALCGAIAEYAPANLATRLITTAEVSDSSVAETDQQEQPPDVVQNGTQQHLTHPSEPQPLPAHSASGPDYTRQRIAQPLERSPLGITLLLVGGLLLEIMSILVWISSGSAQVGGPLFLAGLLAVIIATLARRQRRSG